MEKQVNHGQQLIKENNEKLLFKLVREHTTLSRADLKRLTGLSPTGVRITSARTRFGSCTLKNALNFSLFLMEYSAGAVDYVVLHELCHIRHKNHSRDFYALVARYMPDYKKYVKELRR